MLGGVDVGVKLFFAAALRCRRRQRDEFAPFQIELEAVYFAEKNKQILPQIGHGAGERVGYGTAVFPANDVQVFQAALQQRFIVRHNRVLKTEVCRIPRSGRHMAYAPMQGQTMYQSVFSADQAVGRYAAFL